MKLCLVMPVYNEEECIAQVVRDWAQELGKHFEPDEFKILVVNDGSKDNTGQILDGLSSEIPSLIPYHQPNGGHGKAIYSGYQRAIDLGAEYVFQTDSDNQFEASDFKLLWDKKEQSEFILGKRQTREDGWFRVFITKMVIFLNVLLFWTHIADANIPYRLMKASFLQKIMQQLDRSLGFVPFVSNIFLAVLAARNGADLLSVPVTHKERLTGKESVFGWKWVKVSWLCTKQLLKLRWSLWVS